MANFFFNKNSTCVKCKCIFRGWTLFKIYIYYVYIPSWQSTFQKCHSLNFIFMVSTTTDTTNSLNFYTHLDKTSFFQKFKLRWKVVGTTMGPHIVCITAPRKNKNFTMNIFGSKSGHLNISKSWKIYLYFLQNKFQYLMIFQSE